MKVRSNIWQCLTVLRIRDVYPGFLPIPDPGSRIKKPQQKRGLKKICCHIFFCSNKFHKIVNYFIFEILKKKIWANFQRIIELFSQKLSLRSQKYGFWTRDPRSGIWKNLFRSPDPGVKKAPDPGSGSATLVFKCRKKKRGGGRTRTILYRVKGW